MNAAEERSGGALRRASGKDREGWFTELDAWGAAGRPYPDIAAWLTSQGLSDWWAQKLIVEYEQSRGVREPGARPDGSFAGGASKTIAASVETAYSAFTDESVRRQWLPDVVLRERTSRAGRSVRFDVADGTRLNVDFAAKREGKTLVAVEHTHLADATAAAAAKESWREQLSDLKTLLER